MSKSIFLALCIAATALLSGCKSTPLTPPEGPNYPIVIGYGNGDTPSRPITREPSARAFLPNGPYINNVMVVLNDAGTAPEWYPQVNEVDASMAPTELAGGFALDRWGANERSVFTTWTYDEYGRLASTPTPEEIMRAIIPGSAIDRIVELHVGKHASELNSDIAASALLRGEFTTLYKR